MPEGTVFIVDDDRAVRDSLDLLFTSVGLTVEKHASAEEFLNQYDRGRSGCLVLDVRMPGLSGLELQRELKRLDIHLPIIIITGHGDVPIAVQAMKEGAMDFLEKPFSKQILLDHVRSGMRRDMDRHNGLKRLAQIKSRFATLSRREREVMDLVVAGKLSKQIAVELGISKKTVDVHRARVMHKMDAKSVQRLVEHAFTMRQGQPPADSA